MAQQRTLAIIKPDAVEKKKAGAILALLEESGFSILACKKMHLTRSVAEGFYAVHKARPFFKDLVAFMTSGPVVLMVLEGENAIAKNREVMGATNPANAAPGTIRKDFATDVEKNTVHGSDSPENAKIEIAYFFRDTEITPYATKR